MAAPRVDTADIPVRDRLLHAASTLFAERGFAETSIREIVEAAGVTKGGLYHYFDSKDALLSAIHDRMLTMQIARMNTIADATDLSLTERLHAIFADVVETSIANLDDAMVFFQSMHLLAPEHQARVRAERRRYHERLRDLVAEGQRTGEFRDDIPAAVVIHYHFGALHRLGTWYHPDGSLSAEQVGEYFADLLVRSLAPTDS